MQKLGKGGMASVFEVEHPTLGVHLAMKVFEAEGERAAKQRLGVPANTASKVKRRIEAMIAAMLKMYE